MTGGRVLVTGGAGFVGRAAVRALATAPASPALRLLVHRASPPLGPDRAVEHVTGDLTDPSSLHGLCDGVATVLHLASAVSDDPERCDAVNARGTEALVAAARSADVHRIVYLSTAAVYGYASHRDATEDEVVVAPATPVSRSRARAERAVLEAGGIVLRPLFVYGAGDTRFVPVVVKALRRLPFLVDRGDALLSVIAVGDLAAALAALVLLPDARWHSGAYHATDGVPLAFRELVSVLAGALDVPMPRRSLPYGLARAIVRVRGSRLVGARRWSASAAHRLFLIARDHAYDGARLWTLVGGAPGEPLAAQFAACAPWYRWFLAGGKADAA